MHKRYESLTSQDLDGVDLLVGADICYWDEMTEVLIPMIEKALASRCG